MRKGRKGPYYHAHRHWENNLVKIRIEENYTVKDLCKEAKTHISYYHSLQNGMFSPLYLSGHRKNIIKPWVSRVLKVLNCTFEDAFPNYVCDLRRADLVYEQAIDILYSEYSKNDLKEWAILKSRLLRCLKLLPLKTQVALHMHFYKNATYEEIGKALNMSRQGIEFVIKKGLRRLRHPAMIKRIYD